MYAYFPHGYLYFKLELVCVFVSITEGYEIVVRLKLKNSNMKYK